MKTRRIKASKVLVIGLGLMGLLPLLALLQYRWLGEISQAEREKMKETLGVGAERFQHDLNREITRAYVLFQIRSNDENSELPDFSTNLARWNSDSSFPQLIDEIYWSPSAGKPGDNSLFRFDKATGRLQAVEWPNRLQSVKQQLSPEVQNGPDSNLGGGRTLLDIDGAPALKIPATSSMTLEQLGVLTTGVGDSFTLVTFDLDYMRSRLLPELTRRYFSSEGGLDYNLMIVASSNPDEVIYRSDPRLIASDLSNPDVKEGILGITIGDFQDVLDLVHPRASDKTELASGNTLIAGRMTLSAKPAQRNSSKSMAMDKLSRNGRTNTTLLRFGIRTNSNVAAPAKSLQIYTLAQGGPVPGRDSNSWLLIARNRAGSLEAAVSATRRRNLAASFGILALLSASIVLVVVSSLRSSRVARLQMEFVAGVSHEFRTPLAVISSAAQNLADGIVDDPDQARRYGELIESESGRLTGMVEQVLELAGAQSGRKTYDPRPVCVDQVVAEAVAATRSLLEEKNFVIETNVAPDLPQVIADREALSRSLQNLIHNAIKYAAQGRWIGITARSSGNNSQREVVVSVEDRGIGISMADMRNIFRPFYRARDVVDAQIHGSGLGLSLVKSAVEATGGRVSVESSPGRGSSFALHLPADSQTRP